MMCHLIPAGIAELSSRDLRRTFQKFSGTKNSSVVRVFDSVQTTALPVHLHDQYADCSELPGGFHEIDHLASELIDRLLGRGCE